MIIHYKPYELWINSRYIKIIPALFENVNNKT